MRPLGHTEAREERDATITRANPRLQEMFDQYLLAQYEYWDDLDRCHDWGKYYTHAIEVLRPSRPSLSDLHALILTNPTRPSVMEYDALFGVFVSAGYQLLPQQEIRYDLHTPRLDSIGFLLAGKRLVIDGEVGNHAGWKMEGELIINGVVGNYAGIGMIGSLMMHGTCGDSPGACMIGLYADTHSSPLPKHSGMLGRYNDQWSPSWGGAEQIPVEKRGQFIAEMRSLLRKNCTPSWDAHERECDSLKEKYGNNHAVFR